MDDATISARLARRWANAFGILREHHPGGRNAPNLGKWKSPKIHRRDRSSEWKKVFLRPIAKSDRDLIVDLFNRMSPRSIDFRFLRRLSELPESMIDRLVTVDYHSNFALVAVAKENGKDEIVAVARYGKDADEGGVDLAVAVRDDWQQAGLGKYMLATVVDIAKAHGIARFTGMMHPRNKTIQKLLLTLGYAVTYSMDSGVYRVEIVVN